MKSMSVTEKDVKYIANLARLQLDEKEVNSLAGDMNKILGYMELLDELDTENVEPLEHVIDLESDYFRVPKVIE